MTVLTRWEPFREFSTLQDRMNRVFRDSYSGQAQDESLDHIELCTRCRRLRRRAQGHVEDRGARNRRERHRRPHREQHADRARRAQDRKGRERRELPPRGAPVRQLHPHLHPAHYRRHRDTSRRTTTKGVLKINLPKKAEAKPKQIKVNVGSAKPIEGKTTEDKPAEGKSPSKAA